MKTSDIQIRAPFTVTAARPVPRRTVFASSVAIQPAS